MMSFTRLFLLVCFYAVIVRSEVGDNFNNCKQFFYKRTPPEIHRTYYDTPKSICQMYEDRHHYATLYSTNLRIPVFSAYTLPDSCRGRQPDRMKTWFTEPQLFPGNRTVGEINMRVAGLDSSDFQDVQAIMADYTNTDFDKGHLNPNSYQCDEGRIATFTLTNAVPQDPCFNQQAWKEMEAVSMQTMRKSCSFLGAERFFVTGVVRSRNRIPNDNHDREGDRQRRYQQVTIPSHMWTAACCHDPANQTRGFSFAYFGKNAADSFVDVLTVSALQAKLTSNELNVDRYEIANIFVDDCSENSAKSQRALAQVSVPVDIRVANTVEDLSRTEQSSIPPKKRKLAERAVSLIQSNKVAAYDYSLVRLDFGLTLARDADQIRETRAKVGNEGGAALLLFQPNCLSPVLRSPQKDLDANINSSSHINHKASTKPKRSKAALRKEKEYLDGMDDKKSAVHDQLDQSKVIDEYLMVQDLSADKSVVTVGGDHCRDQSSCGYGKGTYYKWCYTDWDDNWDYCCKDKCAFRGYSYPTCNTGYSKNEPCSKRSSVITVSGKRCIAEHECGLHEKGYYWCYTDILKNWDYCCQPWHICAKHGATYKWCYTDRAKNSRDKECSY